jgi:hypothetical protein
MIDWQAVAIDVANGSNSSQEDYWRDPAMAALHYDGIPIRLPGAASPITGRTCAATTIQRTPS